MLPLLMVQSEFEIALRGSVSLAELPPVLPVAHLTAARWLSSILRARRLEPRPCKVFSANLLYFSYGGVFYRNSKLQTEQVSELPVALVFSPELLPNISHFYPFDSGAMAGGKFGPDWTGRLDPFATRFCVNATDGLTDAQKLVQNLYRTNHRYLKGAVNADSKHKPHPFPILHDFLSADLSKLQVDHRQRTIEAISKIEIELGQHLLWIGFPERRTATVLRALRECTGLRVPQYRTYSYTKNFNPTEIAKTLEDQAFTDVIQRYADFPQ